MNTKTYGDRVESPVGTLLIGADDTHLLSVLYPLEDCEVDSWQLEPNAITDQCRVELQEYFEGRRTKFGLPIRFEGTAFQRSVWEALLSIPFGETTTYATQAEAIGKPNAMRAVGAANGRNRVSIIVPCHRVIGADGKLTGYGGGVERKQWLLRHEQAVLGGEMHGVD